MITPQLLHDLWLAITAIAVFALVATAIYLWQSFQRRFFRAMALILFSVAMEMVCAEIKNVYYPCPPTDAVTALQWLGGRIQELIVTIGALGYLVFGRNGKSGPPVRS